MIKFKGNQKIKVDNIISQLKGFKEIDLPMFSRKRSKCKVQEKLSHKGYVLTCMLFNEEYTNEYLLGAVETITSILSYEENIDSDLMKSLTQLEILISKREVIA